MSFSHFSTSQRLIPPLNIIISICYRKQKCLQEDISSSEFYTLVIIRYDPFFSVGWL